MGKGLSQTDGSRFISKQLRKGLSQTDGARFISNSWGKAYLKQTGQDLFQTLRESLSQTDGARFISNSWRKAYLSRRDKVYLIKRSKLISTVETMLVSTVGEWLILTARNLNSWDKLSTTGERKGNAYLFLNSWGSAYLTVGEMHYHSNSELPYLNNWDKFCTREK